jgi:hypothetical protein
MVIVEAVAKINSVTTWVGTKLAAFLSNSLRSAPSSDYTESILATFTWTGRAHVLQVLGSDSRLLD